MTPEDTMKTLMIAALLLSPACSSDITLLSSCQGADALQDGPWGWFTTPRNMYNYNYVEDQISVEAEAHCYRPGKHPVVTYDAVYEDHSEYGVVLHGSQCHVVDEDRYGNSDWHCAGLLPYHRNESQMCEGASFIHTELTIREVTDGASPEQGYRDQEAHEKIRIAHAPELRSMADDE